MSSNSGRNELSDTPEAVLERRMITWLFRYMSPAQRADTLQFMDFLTSMTPEMLAELSPDSLANVSLPSRPAFRITRASDDFERDVNTVISAMAILRHGLNSLPNRYRMERNAPQPTQHVQVGVTPRLIDQATKCFVYKMPESSKKKEKKDGESGEDQAQSCSICLVDLEHGAIVRRLHCQHVFHKDCIDKWLWGNKTCAMCRADITSQN